MSPVLLLPSQAKCVSVRGPRIRRARRPTRRKSLKSVKRANERPITQRLPTGNWHAMRPGDPDGLITVILAHQQHQLKQQQQLRVQPLNGTQVVDYVYAAVSSRSSSCERTTATTATSTAATSATSAIKAALNTRQSQVSIPIGNASG